MNTKLLALPWLALKSFFVALWYAFWFAYGAIWFIPMLILAVAGKVIYESGTVFHPQPRAFVQRLSQLGITPKSGQASDGGPLFPFGVFVPFGISLGLAKPERVRCELEIVEGPIEKIRVLEFVQGDNESFAVETRTCYYVRDPRLESAHDQLLVHTQRVKAPPLIGRVVDVRWVGSDLGLGVIDRLSADPSIKLGVMESSDVWISVDPKLPGWRVYTYWKRRFAFRGSRAPGLCLSG